MADDKDEPQITPSSNSNEISPLDRRWNSPLAPNNSNATVDGPSDALSKLAASAAAGRAAYDSAQAPFWQRRPKRVRESLVESINELQSIERQAADKEKQQRAAPANPAPDGPPSGQPMHPVTVASMSFLLGLRSRQHLLSVALSHGEAANFPEFGPSLAYCWGL
jgi:hypothetical protein